MEEILTVEEAWEWLQKHQIVYVIDRGLKVYFRKKKDHVLVFSSHTKYVLSKEDFFLLYKTSSFYLLDESSLWEIDEEKDQEYYSWSHK